MSRRFFVNFSPKKFFTGTDGAVTIEAVLWLPMFIILIGIFADVSMIFNNQARILRIIQDGNRRYSTGSLASNSATQTYIHDRIQNSKISSNATVTTSVNADVIWTTVSVPLADIDVFGVGGIFVGKTMYLRADQMKEY